MRWQWVALAAAVAGVGVSIYLTAQHYAGVPLACPTNQMVNCEQVLSSAYGAIGGSGIPTSAAGIVWFAVSGLLAAAQLAGRSSGAISRSQLAWSGIGLLTALYFVFVEIVLLGAICIWCTIAHILVMATFLAVLIGSTTQPATTA